MAAAIERRDIAQWAAANDIVTAHQVGEGARGRARGQTG